MNDLFNKYQNLSEKQKSEVFPRMIGWYRAEEERLSDLEEKIKVCQHDLKFAKEIFGNNSSEANLENEKLDKIKVHYNELRISVDHFKSVFAGTIERLEKETNHDDY